MIIIDTESIGASLPLGMKTSGSSTGCQATARAILDAVGRRKAHGLVADPGLQQTLLFETFELSLNGHLEKIDRVGVRS